jgi:hypothetical protein
LFILVVVVVVCFVVVAVALKVNEDCLFILPYRNKVRVNTLLSAILNTKQHIHNGNLQEETRICEKHYWRPACYCCCRIGIGIFYYGGGKCWQ